MKKMVLLCAAVIACGGLAGCGQHKDNSSAKISSLKAENSSLKAKKSSSHKTKHHRRSSSSSQNQNDNTGSVAQAAKANGSNSAQTAKSNNGQTGKNIQQANQSNGDPRVGDWHNDPELWADVNNNDNWKGSIYENTPPQMRYNYLEDQVHRWDNVPASQGGNLQGQ